MGLFFAFIAFLAWGFGDFSIQRATRSIGTMPALFCIGAFGTVVLLPFAWNGLSLGIADGRIIGLIALTVLITLIAAVFDFEALKRGKISVIEPIMSFELIITVVIGVALLGETVSRTQFLLALTVFLGILLTALRREPRHWWVFWKRAHLLEPGVILTVLGAVAMSFTNIFTGLSSQRTSPVVAIWYIHTSLALICLLVFLWTKTSKKTAAEIRSHWRPALAESIFDNVAWLAYASAVTLLPISITIAITESYVALAAFLGIAWNRERLQQHQIVGMIIAIAAAIWLATISS